MNTYLLQLPFLHRNGSPRCVHVDESDASTLIDSGVVRKSRVGLTGDLYLLTPIIPAAQKVEYQLGSPRV